MITKTRGTEHETYTKLDQQVAAWNAGRDAVLRRWGYVRRGKGCEVRYEFDGSVRIERLPSRDVRRPLFSECKLDTDKSLRLMI